MIDDLTLNTNTVKLRSQNYRSMVTEITAGCSAGDLVRPHSSAYVVGVAVADVTAGEEGVIIYAADKIVLPCDFASNKKAGAIVSFSVSAGKIVDGGSGSLICGVLTEAATTTDTECEVDLFGLCLADEGS